MVNEGNVFPTFYGYCDDFDCSFKCSFDTALRRVNRFVHKPNA